MPTINISKSTTIFDWLEKGLLSILIVLISFFESNQLMNGNQTGKAFGFFIFLGLILIARALKMLFSHEKARYSLCSFDVVLAIYFIYQLINQFFVANYAWTSLHTLVSIGLALIYLIVRTSKQNMPKLVLFSMVVAATFQAAYGTLQLYGIFPSNHSAFNSTGGFFNPGPFAGYLGFVFPIALVLYLFKTPILYNEGTPKRIKRLFSILNLKLKRFSNNEVKVDQVNLLKFFTIVTMALMLIIIPALRSRASWIAIGASVSYVVLKKYNVRTIIVKYLNTKFKIVFAVLFFILQLTSLFLGMYHFKKDSADGRMLIWKVTAGMVNDKPFTGHGHETFKAQYMEGQASFFANNPDSEYEMVADDNSYAFNEFLKITFETGLIGLLLALLIVFQFFFTKTTEKSNITNIAARAGVLSILVFSFFSYPNEILPVKLNFILLLGLLATSFKQLKTIELTRFIPVCSIAVVLLIGFPFLIKVHRSYKDWNSANIIYHLELYEDSIEEFEKAYPVQKHNGSFLINYGKALSMAGEHERAIEVLNKSNKYLTNTILYTALGDSYKALGENQNAEQAYMHAHYMIPSRFYPLYLLAKLYDEMGQKDLVVKIATEVLEQKVKIESTAVAEIKEEMKLLIDKWK